MRDMPKATVATQCLMAAPFIVPRPATAEGRCNVAVDLITNFDTTSKYEPPHDKTNKMIVRPAKTQISLGIRPVWSESSLSAWRKLGSLATHWAHREDSDQTGRCPGWSESSLGAQSFCWFCHEAAHILKTLDKGKILRIPMTSKITEPCHEKTCLMSYAKNKDADQPTHQRSMISVLNLLFAS